MSAVLYFLLAGVATVLGRNPAFPGLHADPNIANFNGTYYVYTTTDGFPGWGGKKFYVWHSTDLVSWTRTEDPILTLDGANGNVPWSSGNAWAPAVVERDGTYYFYFSGTNPKIEHPNIGVASGPSPLGPFKAEAEPMITNSEPVSTGQAIDPAAFVDPKSGKYYLFWGNGSPLMSELADNMISPRLDTIMGISGLTGFTEGPFVIHREPYYHLTYSLGNTGDETYRVGYATATELAGPWTYRGIILEMDKAKGILATGGSSMVKKPGTDEWLIAYHRFKIPGGDGNNREVCLDKLQFDSGNGLILKVEPTL